MITIKQQLFLLEMLWNYNQKKNGIRKEIIKGPIFSNDNDFFKQVKELMEWGYIKTINYEKKRVSYQLSESHELTMNGWAFANIIAKQKNTDERFKKIAKEITWIP
jgi:hypothetical protein